jgi:hypothetical protein
LAQRVSFRAVPPDAMLPLNRAPVPCATRKGSMMVPSMTLSEAVQTLHAHCGQRFPASREGGERRFAALLCEQFHLSEQDAPQVVAKLVRVQAIQWIAEPSLSRPCPGILELFGDWVIQPDRLA